MGRWTRRYSGTRAAAPAEPSLRCCPPSRHRPREGWGRRRPSRSMRRLGCRSVFLRARTARRHAQHVGTSAQQGPCHSPATPPPHRRHTPCARHGVALNTAWCGAARAPELHPPWTAHPAGATLHGSASLKPSLFEDWTCTFAEQVPPPLSHPALSLALAAGQAAPRTQYFPDPSPGLT